MPIIDSNRLKGNQAAYMVAAALSSHCLVRPVGEGTDVGIDLFCEVREEHSQQPFLHFWVQVKTGAEQVKVVDDLVKCSFKKDHLDYWVRQPVPVYAFLLLERDGKPDDGCIHVVSFVRKIIKGELPVSGQDSKVLAEDFPINPLPGSPWTVPGFIDYVRADHAIQQFVQLGVCSPLPSLKPEYVQHYMMGFRTGRATLVADQVRRSLSLTMQDMLDAGHLDTQQERALSVLAEALKPFTAGIRADGFWEEHYGDYTARGRYLKRVGERDRGNKLLNRAKEIVQGDEEFKKRVKDWPELVERLDTWLAE